MTGHQSVLLEIEELSVTSGIGGVFVKLSLKASDPLTDMLLSRVRSKLAAKII